MKGKILLFLTLIILYSCAHQDISSDFEEQILENTLANLNLSPDSTIILKDKQGSFVGDSVKDATMRMFYSGFYICRFSEVDSIGKFSNIQVDGDTIGFEMFHKREIPNKTSTYNIQDVAFLTDYIKHKADSRFFTIDWEKLKNKGIKNIYTFSEITINKPDKYGLIGIQHYTPENLKIMTKYFSFKDSIDFFNLWEGNFNIIDMKCRFKNTELTSIKPNSMIVN